MKQIFLCILLLVTLGYEATAQNYFYKTYSWEKQPKVYVPTEADKAEPYFKVKDKSVYEMAYDADGSAVIYETHHIIFHLNDQKSIDKVNKVYMPTSAVFEELDLKARCVLADNRIIPFNKDGVKKVENLENMGPFTIFPIDGIEAGCDIEYFYTNKIKFFTYRMFNAQVSIPTIHYEFTMISPKNLILETKSYNGLSAFVKETSDTTKNTLSLKENNIAAFDEEKYSLEEATKKSFLVQLAYNTAKTNSKFYTWETISAQYYSSLFIVEKGEQKAIEKLVNKNKLNQGSDAEQKIRSLESFIKTNYLLSNNNDLSLEKSLDEKKLTETNAVKVFIAALKYLKIPFELIYTTNRYDTEFDPKTPSYAFMDDALFFFPDINKFTSPLNIYSRLGYQAHSGFQNSGLSIKETSLGEILTSSSKIKKLPSNDYKDSYHNMSLKVDLNLAEQLVKLDVNQTMKGYLAFYTQPIYRYYDDDGKKEFEKMMYIISGTESVKDFKVTNYEEEDLFVKPLTITYNQDASATLENAGTKYILKLGELIGQQSELYENKKRTTGADVHYTHYLKREIEINIPEGYRIANPDDIIIKKTCSVDGKDAAQFESSYKIEGGKLIVTVYEDYRELKYALKDYEGFKSVINAAADFNKKTLIFEKKQ